MLSRSASPLARQRRLVEQKAAIVQHDEAVLEASRRRLVSRVTREITAPTALIALFVAGLAFGVHRRTTAESDEGQGGRFARASLAWLSAARLLELARSVDASLRG